MADLTQAEADALLVMPKRFAAGGHIGLPPGTKRCYDAHAALSGGAPVNANECQRVIDGYVGWLRHGLAVQPVNGGTCELTTPFLDRHNDHLQLYVTAHGDGFRVSDDGYILADVEQSGLEMSTPKRKEVLETTLNGFGVRLENEALVVEASARNLGQKVHFLVQAMLAVNDMYVMAQHRVLSVFWEDVRDFLDLHQIRYSPRVKIGGTSGFDHAIDFIIPKSLRQPERIVQAINAPAKNTIAAYLFTLTDTRQARGQGSQAYAFLNDASRDIGADILDALQAYRVFPVVWSRRDRVVDALAS